MVIVSPLLGICVLHATKSFWKRSWENISLSSVSIKQGLGAVCLFFVFCFLFFFLAALGLRCCARAFSSCGERGLLFVAVRGLLIVVASLVAEHGL